MLEQLKKNGFVISLLTRLHAAGHEAFIVGGAVRNAILSIPIKDWDIATSASTREMELLFPDLRRFTMKHGTVTLLGSNNRCETTTFRGSAKTIRNDLELRDFTVNAMAFDIRGDRVIDHQGGQRDLKRSIIRAVGMPSDRFEEDPIRLLRAIRLCSELDFHPEPYTLASISENSPLLDTVSRERIRDELTRLLLTVRPSQGFRLAAETGLLKHFLPELMECVGVAQNDYHSYSVFGHTLDTIDRTEADLTIRLTALFHDLAKPVVIKHRGERRTFHGHEKAGAVMAVSIMRRLRFNVSLTEKVGILVSNHMIDYNPSWSDSAVRRLIKRVGRENIQPLLKLREADVLAHGKQSDGLSMLNHLRSRIYDLLRKPLSLHMRDLAIDGNDVMDILGIGPGPAVGKILEQLMDKAIDEPAINSREDLLSLIESIRQETPLTSD